MSNDLATLEVARPARDLGGGSLNGQWAIRNDQFNGQFSMAKVAPRLRFLRFAQRDTDLVDDVGLTRGRIGLGNLQWAMTSTIRQSSIGKGQIDPLHWSLPTDAATRGYAAIQVAQRASRTSQTCATTCHLQAYGAFASRAIHDRGLRFDEAVTRADAVRGFRRMATNLSAAVEGNSLGEIAMNEAFWLVAAHEIGLRPTVVTAAVARAVALKQNPAGDWPALGERPPSNHSPFTFTALGLRSL